MLKNRVIPCLDVKEGRVVKGINFDNLVDAGDPVVQAKFYFDSGADELCFLDIAASNENRDIIYSVINKVAKVCFIPLTVGGGVRSVDDIRNLLLSGADKISINSSAVNNPSLVQESSRRFGNQCIIVAIDVKKSSSGIYEVFTHGGTKNTGIDGLKWAKQMEEFGAGEILLTSMDRDGTKSGYDLELVRKVSSQLKIPVIASGGVGNLSHLAEGIKSGATAVLAASIFHFQKYTIKQAKDFLAGQGIAIRNINS